LTDLAKAKQERRDALLLMGLGCLVFLLLGFVLRSVSPESMSDFKTPFYGTRCLLQGCDPYDQQAVTRLYDADARVAQNHPTWGAGLLFQRPLSIPFLYPPSIFPVTAPLALLSYPLASFLWTLILVAGLIASAFLMWTMGAKWSPLPAGALLGFLLANCELPVVTGNPASLAIGLCAIALWYFRKDRHGAIGAICLGIGLLVKPHDLIFIWMYCLLAGGKYRKYAVQAALAAAILGIPIVLWTTHVSPHWAQELQATLAQADAPGGINDPGPNAPKAHGLAMVIHLQTAISLFKDDPYFYNIVSFLICGALLCMGMVTTLRVQTTPPRFLIGLASVSALTMLPFYHRVCDAKMLMFAVPACAMLWSERSRTGRWAVFFTGVAIVCTADLPWLVVLATISKLHLPTSAWAHQVIAAVQILPAPLSLLAVGCFYLWVYGKRVSGDGTALS
jgi:hypothetical protein